MQITVRIVKLRGELPLNNAKFYTVQNILKESNVKMPNSDFNRRSFMKGIFTTFLAVPLLKVGSVLAETAKCGAAPAGKKIFDHAGKKKGKADSIGYVVNYEEAKEKHAKFEANKDDKALMKFKKFKAGSKCGNCKFYKVDKGEGDWAPCQMLVNAFVPNCGWCNLHNLDKKKLKKA